MAWCSVSDSILGLGDSMLKRAQRSIEMPAWLAILLLSAAAAATVSLTWLNGLPWFLLSIAVVFWWGFMLGRLVGVELNSQLKHPATQTINQQATWSPKALWASRKQLVMITVTTLTLEAAALLCGIMVVITGGSRLYLVFGVVLAVLCTYVDRERRLTVGK